jgi:predicted peptidase
MGGFATWDLAAEYPKVFAAIAPICGGGNPDKAQAYVGIPTWVFHGAKDGTVRVEESQKMVDAIKAAGGDPKFTIYPDAGHDSWTATYDNPEFYEWMFAQKKAK